ncbi:hypothetical protein LOTGIDRAFT_237263 [Lottia gigantea]|uniref:Kazal-like domain-containing protein n=1 Tax=Lottia gigantea TaxID=225164 RepID=V4AKK1_LOTGI|nr:hypothetical protein LOTGIDRAFT_237263 [Lottia gigantea]ESP04729.1 hypothetical protein LOTGIDRAFT_237263 [Lottia gigantea]
MLKIVALALVSTVVVLGQTFPHTDHSEHHHGTSICAFIGNADCSIFAPHTVCGTDGKTYNSKCDFSKAHCISADLHVVHNGTCDPTIDKVPNVHGNELVHQFFCANLQHSKCGTDFEIVCGTDLVTYDNLCLFEKARCSNVKLNVYTYQACPT